MNAPSVFEQQVEASYCLLSDSVSVDGPCNANSHTAYIISGLSDTPEQVESLCWCILGFLDEVDEVDLKLRSIIGTGEQASKNLKNALDTYFDITENTESIEASKFTKRNALIAEIISHILVHLHHRKNILTNWIGDVAGCRSPHLNANDGGIDLIALGFINARYLAAIGEAKAYKSDPVGGFNKACEKFSQVREGIYNREIRGALKHLCVTQGLTQDELAKNIWETTSNFGAFVSYDQSVQFDASQPIERSEVKKQPADRLFLLATPYENMEEVFDAISNNLLSLANSLGEQA
jgi:hypothetical protein